jgi:hypothetical protein
LHEHIPRQCIPYRALSLSGGCIGVENQIAASVGFDDAPVTPQLADIEPPRMILERSKIERSKTRIIGLNEEHMS